MTAVFAAAIVVSLAVFVPRAVPWLIVLTFSQGLGFLPFAALEELGIPDHATLVALAVGTAAGIRLAFTRSTYDRYLVGFALLYGLLLLLGITLPVARGESGLLSAVRDGKAFLLVGFALHSATYRDPGSVAIPAIWLIALYSAAVVLIHRVTGLHPPAYGLVLPGEPSAGIHVFGPLFMVLWFATLRRSSRHLPGPALMLSPLVFAGVLLQAHLSATLAAVLMIAVAVAPHEATRTTRILGRRPVVVILVLLPLVALAWRGRPQLTAVVEATPALQSRMIYDAFRYQAIVERPLVGYGFIDEASSLGEAWEAEGASRFDRRLGTVDSGYVDLLSRFGLLGTLVILVYWGRIAWKAIMSGSSPSYDLGCFILLLFGVNVTWSVFSYPLGLLPLIFSLSSLSKVDHAG